MTILTLKMNKFGVVGAKKWSKPLAGHDLGKEFFKEDWGGGILSIEEYICVGVVLPVDKRVKIFHIYYLQIINIFLRILRFATNNRVPITEDAFDHFPSLVLHYGVLEDMLVQVYSSA